MWEDHVFGCYFYVISIPFLNIRIGLLVFVNVIQIFDNKNVEIKYQTLTLMTEPVQLHGFF